MNFYNENDPKAAAWLRELISSNLIPAGVVDERSITEILPDELSEFTQCHFFAGIGGWSFALQLAGWPSTKPVWTGSCPCQPFSHAGKQLGRKDPRHLWPAFRRLINRGNPAIVFGEQVASKDGRKWLTGVFANLETMGYAAAGADLCAAGVGAPHIRQRLYWMANATGERRNRSAGMQGKDGRTITQAGGRLGHSDSGGRTARESSATSSGHRSSAKSNGNACGMADPDEQGRERQSFGQLGPVRKGDWSNFDLLPCTDGKARRVESGTFPLAHGVSGRVGLLRGYGNAIVPQTAALFIEACSEILAEEIL